MVCNELNMVSEETANQLINSFKMATESMKGFESQMKQAVNSSYKLALTMAANKVAMYLEKSLKSTWVTRWYWKQKCKKAMNALDSLISICPPPEHFPCRCDSVDKILVR